MSLNLPNGAPAYLPDVPNQIKTKNPEVYDYLVNMRREAIKIMAGLVDNDLAITNVINTGTSGTFVTSGVSFIFVNGLMTSTT